MPISYSLLPSPLYVCDNAHIFPYPGNYIELRSLVKLLVSQLVKRVSTFYGIRRFITVFQGSHNSTITPARQIQPIRSLKVDSHIAFRAHAFPCHAIPLRVYNVSFPFDLHSAALSDSHLPCFAHAMLRPYRSSQGHGTAWPSREGLWATCPRSASSGYHAGFHEGCSQTHTYLRCRWSV
jgi:hypothetical protein